MNRDCCRTPRRGALLLASVSAPHPCSDGLSARRPAAGTVLKPGEFLGTAAYSSLEALQHYLDQEGGGGFDLQRNDSYAAGVTLFELLTGALPVVVAEEEEYLLPAYEAAILRSVLARRILSPIAARGALVGAAHPQATRQPLCTARPFRDHACARTLQERDGRSAMLEQLYVRGASPECQQLLMALLQPRQADGPLPRDALAYAWFHVPA